MGTTNTLDLNNRVGALKKVIATKVDKTATASGETLALIPTSEGRVLIHTAYGMSTQSGTPTPSVPVDIVSAKVNLTSTHGQESHNVTTDITLRAIEVTSSDAYNLVRDGKYYIADTLDYSEDNGFGVARRVGALTFDGSDDTNFTIASNSVSSNKRLIYNNAIIPSYQDLGYSNAWHKGSINSNFLPECIESANQPYNSVETIGLHLSNHQIQLYIAGKSSVADYMAAFVSNPLNVIYRLATPTTEAITTAQALALLGLKTYDESTTISSQAEPACTIAVEYAKERLGALALMDYAGVQELTEAVDEVKSSFWSLGSGISIANNTDLNDITTPGNYYATTPAAATLSHCPITGAFKLKVLYDVRESASTYIEQVFNPMSSYDEYRRYKAGSAAWSDWHLTNCNLDNIITKIPDAPTTDGTYNLSVTVVNGTPTYSWVSA